MPPFHIYIHPAFRNKSGVFLTGAFTRTPVKKSSFFIHEGLAMQLGLQLSFDSKQIDDIRSGVYLGEVRTLDSKLHQGSDCTFSQSFS